MVKTLEAPPEAWLRPLFTDPNESRYRIGIVGSRDYMDYDAIKEYINDIDSQTVVVSGGARGVDSFAVSYAKVRGLRTKEFPVSDAEWKKDKGAGYRRNEILVAYVDEIAAYWDGTSRGTHHTIGLAEKSGKLIKVFPARLLTTTECPNCGFPWLKFVQKGRYENGTVVWDSYGTDWCCKRTWHIDEEGFMWDE